LGLAAAAVGGALIPIAHALWYVLKKP
jgi:hypothetical protein